MKHMCFREARDVYSTWWLPRIFIEIYGPIKRGKWSYIHLGALSTTFRAFLESWVACKKSFNFQNKQLHNFRFFCKQIDENCKQTAENEKKCTPFKHILALLTWVQNA